MARRKKGIYGDGSLFQRADGMWVARLELGEDLAGNRLRWTGKSMSYDKALEKLQQARLDKDNLGFVPKKGQLLSTWLDHWLETIVIPKARPGTTKDYRQVVSKHLTPRLGKVALDKLTPAHVRKMHADVMESVSLATANKAHRVLRAALSDAQRDGLVPRNVAKLIQTPTLHADKAALTITNAKRLVKGRVGDRMASRWTMAVLTGARQGECLGLEWDRVDLDAGIIDISWQLQVLPMRHGCSEDKSCGKKRASTCPQAQFDVPMGLEYRILQGSYALTRPKSAKGTRLIPIAAPLAEQLRKHRLDSIKTKNPLGLVWVKEDGSPIDKSSDLAAWTMMLQDLGIPEVGLHNARHTTATLLMEMGYDVQIIQAIMGHSQATTTQMYQHADLTMARKALDGLGSALG